MIELGHVTKVYRMGAVELRALDDVTLTIGDREMVAIMGASGSGKSTLMNILGCLDAPTEGHYRLDGTDVSHLSDAELAHVRNHKIGFVFQSFNLLPRTSAIRNVELPLIYGRVPDRRAKARAALARVGLADREKHLPTELSGGQQQRVAIARALVTDPTLLLADEPTGNLDTAASIDIVKILVELNDAGHTVVIITHEPDIAAFTERIIELRDGRVVSDRPVRDRTPAGARHALNTS
ncbi:ABC transporter ATP-binding protein [Pseudonocardia acaciae]|uniref:ABC transporter ATP-binding protein n=1 Tax=Pseudonocardia acaciae TaxID=551276 RepID=UPI00055AEBE9|nr:ABC transporter ATP-binding protein [Pseudonocardia acaciae]